MITAHKKESLTLNDGAREHQVNHRAFVPMRPYDQGGIHPLVTEEYQGYLPVQGNYDWATCPVEPLDITHDDPTTERKVVVRYLPIIAYLQAHYGPDKQIVTVPINGDAMAQRLHWLHRDAKGRKEMKAVLEWMGAWRLTDDGEVPA